MTNAEIVRRERNVIGTLLHDVEQGAVILMLADEKPFEGEETFSEFLRTSVENCADTGAIVNQIKSHMAGAC